MKNLILMIDPRSHIRNNSTVIERHIRYAAQLDSSSKGESALVILSFGLKEQPELLNTGTLTVIYLRLHLFGLPSKFRDVKKRIDSLGRVRLLVSGDPWEGALLAVLIRGYFFSKVPIQIQIHADLGDKNWLKTSYKNRAKAQIAHLTLNKADNVRCVSTGQAHKIASIYAIEMRKISVIPVPTHDGRDETRIDLNRPRQHSVGFIGRLQKDRGTDLFIKVIEKLNLEKPNLKVVIAGSGPDGKEFIGRLCSILEKSRVVYLGEVSPQKMGEIWDQIGVLLSCPPSESYGRALREALANGVPIWITPTTGGLQFAQTLNPDYYRVLDHMLEPKELLTQYCDLIRAKISRSSVTEIRELNEIHLQELIHCWLQLALGETE